MEVKQKPDFSGWATKNNLRCSDGRTIMPGAFQHQDHQQVPLVWQHGHTDPENVLGHAILENRDEGVYAYAFFNNTPKGQHAKSLVQHKDIKALSIWANQLMERAKNVIHGQIREVSLVLSGANPGAIIDQIAISHSDIGEPDEILDDEAIITTGFELEHSDFPSDNTNKGDEDIEIDENLKTLIHGLTDEQKVALSSAIDGTGTVTHTDATATTTDPEDAAEEGLGPDSSVKDILDSMTEMQRNAVYYMIGEALDSVGAAHSDDDDDTYNADDGNQEGNGTMKHNVFEGQGTTEGQGVLSHDDMQGIVADAQRRGSLKHAVEEYALAHGITNISTLFPEVKALDTDPQFLSRRVEWVQSFLSQTRKSPFSRIKTIYGDLTFDQARAKGYVKASMKKEEFFGVSRRTTVPTTVYKKQKLDRDDILDITDFSVVTWLEAEMRLMLDEEIARAALLGDGRDVSDGDKIDSTCIRPIATDSEIFAIKCYVNLDDANSSIQELVDILIAERWKYKGTGLPTFFTTETILAKFLLLKDSLGRRIYNSVDDIALELRASSVVPVEAMEGDPTIVGILVNPVDYVFGTDQGADVTMFDFFDIDYNQMKYLIETRCSGALTRLRSAIVVLKTAAVNVLVAPVKPTFVNATGVLTIVDQVGVVYKNGATVVNTAGSPYAAIASGASITIDATPAAGYYFADTDNDQWIFTRN